MQRSNADHSQIIGGDISPTSPPGFGTPASDPNVRGSNPVRG